MPIKNPALDGIGVRSAPPVITDYTQTLQSVGELAGQVLENRKTNILEGFRGEVSTIQDKAIAQSERDLSAEDQSFTSDFARRMDRIHRIATQGASAGARTRALLEAETALRRAQRERPALAAELRQEASLVLGTDPTGTKLELMEKAAKDLSEQAAKDWADHVKHGYEDLGIPRTIAPGSQEWFSNYAALDEKYASNLRIKNDLELLSNIEDITESNRAQAQYWLSNPEGVFRATVDPLNKAMKAFASISPSQRLSWMGGQGTLNIGGQDITFQQLKATLEASATELDASLSGLNEETRTALAPAVTGLKSRIEQTLQHLGDSKFDPAVIASQFEMETNGFLSSMTSNERYTLFMTKQLAPFIQAINGSDFAKTDLVMKNKMIDLLTSLGGFSINPPDRADRPFEEMISSQAGNFAGRSKEESSQLAFQDYLGKVREFNKVLANSNQDIPEDVAGAYANQWVGAAKWIKNTPNVSPALVEQWLENFQDPQTLAILQKAAPDIGEEYAKEIVDFFNDNSSPMTGVYDEIRAYRNTPRYRGDRTLPASDILTPVLRPDGQVILQFAEGSALTDVQKANYISKMRTWGDALTRRVRAQATLDQLIDNTTDKPDYQRAYNKMAAQFPFTNMVK